MAGTAIATKAGTVEHVRQQHAEEREAGDADDRSDEPQQDRQARSSRAARASAATGVGQNTSAAPSQKLSIVEGCAINAKISLTAATRPELRALQHLFLAREPDIGEQAVIETSERIKLPRIENATPPPARPCPTAETHRLVPRDRGYSGLSAEPASASRHLLAQSPFMHNLVIRNEIRDRQILRDSDTHRYHGCCQWLCLDGLGRRPRISRGRSPRLVARRRSRARFEPAHDRPPPGLVRSDLRRTDLVRPAAGRVAPQRGRGRVDPVAEELETAALALERRRAAASPALSGTVRVSVGEWGGGFLARHLDQSSETRVAADPDARTRRIVGNRQSRPPGRRPCTAPRRARRRKSLRIQGRRDRLRRLPPA